MSSSLTANDAEAGRLAVSPRVTLEQLKSKVSACYYFTAHQAITACVPGSAILTDGNLEVLTLCILVVENGFTLVGKSAPASPTNFNPEFGRKLAYEDALKQLWPLEGYLLRSYLHNMETA